MFLGFRTLGINIFIDLCYLIYIFLFYKNKQYLSHAF